MQLLRDGAKRKRGGLPMLPDSDPHISWSKESKAVRLSYLKVRDVDKRNTTYDYHLYLTVDDIQKIIAALAEGAR